MLQAEGQWLGFLPAPFLPSSLFSFPLSFSFSKHSHAHMCNSRILSWGVKMQPQGTFLEIQCLILTPNAGSPIPGQGPKTHMLQLRAHRWQIQLRPSAAKKKKIKKRLSPYSHVSHSPVGCHRSKTKWHTSSQWGFTNSTPSPAETTVTSICACSVAQSCQTLCSPMNCSQPGSSVQGVLQARILEGVAILFSRGSSQSRYRTRDSWIAGGFYSTDPPGKLRKSSLQCLSWQRPIKRLQKQWLHLKRGAWLLKNSTSLAVRLRSQLLAVWPCWGPSSPAQPLTFTKPVRERVKQIVPPFLRQL